MAQTCPRLQNPANGSTGVPVDATITWNIVGGVEGYLISLGTSEGATDILNRRSAGPLNSYVPELGLPENTRIYVTLSIFLTGGNLIVCPGESFSTVDVTTPPSCTDLTGYDGSSTSLDFTRINWAYAPTATGYRVSIGTNPGAGDIADNVDVGNTLSYTPPTRLPLDEEIFVRVVPYNENGDASGCGFESVILSEPELDCSPFLPMIDIPDQVALCANEGSISISPRNQNVNGFRWFKTNEDQSETLVSENRDFSATEIGTYRFETYTIVAQNGVPIECTNSKEFSVVRSEGPTITSIELTRQASGLRIEVNVSGIGNYEYSLNKPEGPFSENAIFQNVPNGEYTLFVRDKNGCGMTERAIEPDLSRENFPAFFTPNQDGINDFWQFIPSKETGEINLENIRIYNRYGNLLAQIDPKKEGWEGNFRGRHLPATDYWFSAISFGGKEITGHFTLKR